MNIAKMTLKQAEVSGLKYYTRLGIYKNPRETVTFNPKTMEAYSYRWWMFLELHPKFGLIFNTFGYSANTSKHQSKLRSVLSNLNIKIDHFVRAPKGLQDRDYALAYIYSEMFKIELDLTNTRRKKSLDGHRQALIAYHKQEISFLKQLGAKVSQGEIVVLAVGIEESNINSYLRKQADIADKEQNNVEFRAKLFKSQINKIVSEAQ